MLSQPMSRRPRRPMMLRERGFLEVVSEDYRTAHSGLKQCPHLGH
jgi:hypothetical protein